jgi:arginine deiminase
MAISIYDSRSATVSASGVRSETGALRRVMVHRPGAELERLTAANAGDLLFDGVVSADRARSEHDAFVQTLLDCEVEVLHLTDLLTGALLSPAAKIDLIEAACATVAPDRYAQTLHWLYALEARRLAEVLVEGVGFEEAGQEPSRGGGRQALDPDYAVMPLVNQMFVRDTSAWLGTDLVLGAASNPIRARETCGVEAIYRHHPLFARTPGCRSPIVTPEIEGGDLMSLSDRTVLLGIGSRTSIAGAKALAGLLFDDGFERILGVRIPRERSCIHLDCLMTVVDRDAVLMDRRLLDSDAVEFRPSERGVEASRGGPLPWALASALEVDAVRVVEVADEGEQWNLAANTLAVAPGKVIAFDQNVRTNEALTDAGIEVLPVPGEELSRGRGGPRCLSCPLNRDPLDRP